MPVPAARERAARFCARFGLRLPVLLAPMAGACPPGLSAAVANAGGMGACGALLLRPEAIAAWMAEFHAASNGACQINLWIPDPPPRRDPALEAEQRRFLGRWGPPVPPEAGDASLQDFAAQCRAVLDAGPAAMSGIMGLYPSEVVSEMKRRGIAWFATATTVAEARAAEAAGADVIVAQGAEAGGHRGAFEASSAEEAAHQTASNPLPPRPRKPGAVDPAAGPEVAILDEDGTVLPQGAVGEVAIRGPNVTPGYDDPRANARAFTGGWFRAGDEGRFDEEGYLFLTGRLKERINRGGEKVSPPEVDVMPLDHPAVARAVTFALPYPTPGEEVDALVVTHAGERMTEQEVRDFAAARLAAFEVPRRVPVMDDIPKGATGEVRRIGPAHKLGLGGPGAS